MSVHDTKNDETREEALEAAVQAIRDGKLIVLPTDTVYGIGADAFSHGAVMDLLYAKGRGRETPPPVLVGDPAVLMALAVDVPEVAERLAEEFWPGALTLILNAQPSLTWDLGETRGTVALRMPDHEVALDLLRRTGPLAVSSANRHGKSPALTVLDAATQLGDAVEVYLDGGEARIGESSTIIDATVEPPEIVRQGALTKEEIIERLGDIFAAPEHESADGAEENPAEDEATVADEVAMESSDQDAADQESTDESTTETASTVETASAEAPAEESAANEPDVIPDPSIVEGDDQPVMAPSSEAVDASKAQAVETVTPAEPAAEPTAAPAEDDTEDTTPSAETKTVEETPAAPAPTSTPSAAPSALSLPSEPDLIDLVSGTPAESASAPSPSDTERRSDANG